MVPLTALASSSVPATLVSTRPVLPMRSPAVPMAMVPPGTGSSPPPGVWSKVTTAPEPATEMPPLALVPRTVRSWNAVMLRVPAARLTSRAVPVALSVSSLTARLRVPVVPALRLTSMPSAVAPRHREVEIVSEDEPVRAPVEVRSMALPPPPVDASERPRTSIGIAWVMPTVLAAEVMAGRVPAATRFTGAALPLRLRGIDRPTPSPRRCWLASSTMELERAGPVLWTKM